MSEKLEVRVYNEEGDDVELALPAHYIVCPTCRGKGSHVNPAIDGHGISSEEMDELGPEFFEDYMSGTYDVNCSECRGQRVVLEVDRERADPTELRLYDEHLRQEWEYEAERAAEIAAGC